MFLLQKSERHHCSFRRLYGHALTNDGWCKVIIDDGHINESDKSHHAWYVLPLALFSFLSVLCRAQTRPLYRNFSLWKRPVFPTNSLHFSLLLPSQSPFHITQCVPQPFIFLTSFISGNFFLDSKESDRRSGCSTRRSPILAHGKVPPHTHENETRNERKVFFVRCLSLETKNQHLRGKTSPTIACEAIQKRHSLLLFHRRTHS